LIRGIILPITPKVYYIGRYLCYQTTTINMAASTIIVNHIAAVDKYYQPAAAGEVAARLETTLRFLLSVMLDSSFDSFAEEFR